SSSTLSSPINAEFIGAFDNSRITLPSGEILSYHDGAQEKPALLFLHGLNAHSGTWRNNAAFFSTESRVLAPSLPPWHGSQKDLDIGPYVESLKQFLAELGVRRVSIVGNSMGGWIAMRLAADLNGKVEGLVLEDTAGTSDPRDPKLLTKVEKSGVPVLIIWGKNDKILPLEVGKYLHSKIKASTFVVLDGVGHVPHWEVPDIFNKLVMDFLMRVKETQSRPDK
ncbi:MAG TPA: alpha/beta hydrolase, partial [Nitrososphaerales archaeon]|nr:alpha/beta hydrolase [Nitrososphaerales archaeon]